MTSPAPAPPGSSRDRDPVTDAVARWRLDLSRVGDRDALLHYEDLPTGTLDLATAHPGGLAQFLAGRPTRLSSLFREPAAHAAARRSARAIRATVSALADEHGLDAGRLAVGMVVWTPPGQAEVVAPVLLRPLVLRPRGAGQTDDDLDLGTSVEVNPALVRLLARHGVFVDPAELVALCGGTHGFAPRPALARLRAQTAGLEGLVVADRTVVGTFVDLAPSLVADLDRLEPGIATHPVASSLAAGGPRVQRAAVPRTQPRAAVLDLDPGQRTVVDAVLDGASVAVHAAPGTGATQLLAEIVAATAARGRRTLLVAPRRGELDDVRSRLGSVGLASLVHAPTVGDEPVAVASRSGTERPVAPGQALDPAARAVAAARERLVGRHRALHGRHRPGGVSVAGVVDELTRLRSSDAPPSTAVRLPVDVLSDLGHAQREAAAADLQEAAGLGAFSARAQESPWYGATLVDEDEARDVVATAQRLHAESLPAVRQSSARLASEVGLSGGSSVQELRAQLELLVGVRSTLDVLTPAVYERSVTDLVTATASRAWRADRGISMSLLERRRWRRQAQDLVRPGSSPSDLHAVLQQAQAERLAWQRASSGGGWPRVPTGLAAADAALHAVTADLERLERALVTTRDGGGLLTAPLDALASRLERLAGDPEAADRVPRLATLLGRLRAQGLGELLEDLLRRGVEADRVTVELELAWWASVLDVALAEDGDLLDADDGPAEDVVAATRQWRAEEVARVLASQAEGLCTAVSPFALPLLPPEEPRDVVLLAGAHGWGVAEAVLALARGRQVVVVGDPEGLPPTVLRLGPERPGDEDLAARTSPRSSLLDVASRVLEVHHLDRQHRMPAQVADVCDVLAEGDRRPSAVPAPEGLETLRLDVVPDGTGVPDADGAIESPDVEVQHTVGLVVEHARTRPAESLAVLAVGRHHARRVAEALRAELPEHPDVAGFFTRPPGEPFVITDLTRCEDAVRDAVVLSVGLGRTPHGRVLHRFGVLDSDVGRRLLAAGVTRARHRLRVVSCLTADDLDPDRLRTPGAVALRALLATMAAADVPPAPSSEPEPEPEPEPEAVSGVGGAPLLTDLGARLEALGLRVRTGARGPDLVVTRADFSRATAVLGDVVDLGDDEDALLEREVHLPAALRRRGWRVVHVRTRPLFADPQAQVDRVVAAVDS